MKKEEEKNRVHERKSKHRRKMREKQAERKCARRVESNKCMNLVKHCEAFANGTHTHTQTHIDSRNICDCI